MRPDQAFQLLDPDAIANAAQHARPGLGGVLQRKPRTVIQYSVSAMVPIIGNDSIHLQPCCPKKAILDLWRDRCDIRCGLKRHRRECWSRRGLRHLAAATALAIPPGHDVSHGLARCRETSAFCSAAAVADRNPPIAVLVPIVAEQLGGMLRTTGAVATSQRILWAILVAPPANSFRVLRMQGEYFRHL